MRDVQAAIRLRPTRIGFLVRPTDMASVKKIMASCCCLWGGIYNPIIPVFKTAPRDWRGGKHGRLKGAAIAKGYINFFEPDVYVESEEGLGEEADLGALRKAHSFRDEIVSLKAFLATRDHKDWSEPFFGLSVTDVYRHLYMNEQRFAFRDKVEAMLVKPDDKSGLVEAIFGAFPRYRPASYIEKAYIDVFAPAKTAANVETWRNLYLKRMHAPLQLTRHGLELRRWGAGEILIFVFDPLRPTDLIDLWNLRLEPHPVLPVPVAWLEDLAHDLRRLIKIENRPMRGNPQGLKHQATVEFARSISEERAKGFLEFVRPGLPERSFCAKLWRTPIWENHRDDFVHRDTRMRITAKERSVTIPIKASDRSIMGSFDAMSPVFAETHGGHSHRWANVVTCSVFGNDDIATVLPFNTYDRRWPRIGLGGETVTIGSEGWAFSQRYARSSETVTFLTKGEAVIGALEQREIKAVLSDPGHVAKQMLDHLGGLGGVRYIADLATITLLNKMAAPVRRRTNGREETEELFPLRSEGIKAWTDIISRRRQKLWSSNIALADLTNRKILRLGLETSCPHCHTDNWHSLSATDYELTCERCLKPYEFPQADIREKNRNWAYRVIGPFSVPDYGRGAYSSLLTLRALQEVRSSHNEMTFSTALNLEFEGRRCEVDFIALWRKESFETSPVPAIIIGETKSLGAGDLIKLGDLSRLKELAAKLPGAYIAIAVMRDHFTTGEKALLRPFVQWARRLDADGHATNPVILLTGHELFADHDMLSTWKELGEPYVRFTDHFNSRNLELIAQSTQAIHLGLPPLWEVRRERWERRAVNKQAPARS
jgi:hypothetical protein